MIIRTIDDKLVEVSNESPKTGDPYIFKNPNDKKGGWHFGEMWNHMPSEGGRNMLELINPKMIRKRVIKIL